MSPSQIGTRLLLLRAARTPRCRDDERDDAEQQLQRRGAEHVRREAAEQPAGRRRDFEHHAEPQVDQVTPVDDAAAETDAGRRDHRRRLTPPRP